jgi:hypothetical protein
MRYRMLQTNANEYTVKRLTSLHLGDVWVTIARGLTRAEALNLLNGKKYEMAK